MGSMRNSVIWAAAVIALVAGCSSGQPAAVTETSTSKAPVPTIKPEVLAEMPHDTSAWTQGLEFDGPTLYEGTGVAGQSQLRELDPETGAVLRAVPAPNNYYGEGITVVGDRIWELTWQNNVAVEWDKATMTPLREVPVNGEGWGLCNDGDRLIRSDGSDRLIFHDPETFAETGSIAVTRDGNPVSKPQRTGMRGRSGVGQHLDVRHDRADRPGDRRGEHRRGCQRAGRRRGGATRKRF